VADASIEAEVNMLETAAIPILLKAVEFLFGEGGKILEEHRERRKAQLETQKEEKKNVPTPAQLSEPPREVIQSKETAISQPIPETAWLNSEAKIKHLMSLLEVHTKNYYLAKEQYAKWGSTLVPPIIVHNLSEAEDQIAATAKELESALSKVYGKRVTTPALEQV
jgi:hypothetical protein